MGHFGVATGSTGERTALASAAGVDVHRLQLLQRVLLISDGTLTDIVETAFLEPIRLVKLKLEVAPAAQAIDALELPVGEPVMHREILLQGQQSGENYVYAQSSIALNALPDKFREELVNTDIPLGRLWVQHRLETRKEILKVWHIPAGEWPSSHFSKLMDSGLLARSYRVFCGGRPIMLISEYFPAGDLT